jgi:hypothetical protein
MSADIRAINENGVIVMYAETERAAEWLLAEYGEPEGLSEFWALETQYFPDMVRCAEGDGLVVENDGYETQEENDDY